MKGVRALIGLHEFILVALLGAIGMGVWALDSSFLDPAVQLGLASHAAELGMLAVVMTLIIIAGGIDLSVGSMLALSGVVFGLMHEAGLPTWANVAGALATGTCAGGVNGLFTTVAKVHPLIVTLATLAAYRGLAVGISRGRPVSGFSESFQWFGGGEVRGVPLALLYVGAAALLAMVVTWRGTMGLRVYTVGGNERAARYAGVPVDRLKVLLYTLSGTTAAFAALVLAARRNTAKADMGTGIELEVITAVVLGGTSIQGGKGRIIGTLLGVVVIHEVREFIGWHWEKDELILIVIGAILIAAVLMNNAAARVLRRKKNT